MDGWEAGRAVVAFTAVFYTGMWVQVTFMHWAGGFRRTPMWTPVVASLRNLLSGPPPVLMAYALVGILGLGGLVWHA